MAILLVQVFQTDLSVKKKQPYSLGGIIRGWLPSNPIGRSILKLFATIVYNQSAIELDKAGESKPKQR